MRPKIGVTAAVESVAAYEAAITAAGGEPVRLDAHTASLDGTLAGLDGLLLTGGGDIEPHRFGAASTSRLRAVLPWRDDFELAVANAAHDADVPCLGICRGIQVMVVAMGGTLIQHLPKEAPSSVNHDQKAPRPQGTHLVDVAPGRLQEITGASRLLTNSFHHQAALRVPPGLSVTACAEDGIVEGVEAQGRRFFVGVQWHPEHMIGEKSHLALFEALVGACRVAVR